MSMQSETAKPDVFAQAEYWFVRLQAENCSPQEQMAFRQWQADPACAEAFEATEALWHEVGNAREHPEIQELSRAVLAETAQSPVHDPQAPSHTLPRLRGRVWEGATKWAFRPMALAASIAIAAVALGSALWLYEPNAYTTGLGEQQTVALSDGSTVILNTDTRLEVDFTEDTRRLSLVRGEALFDVSKDAERPFLVAAGDNWVMALGTRFQIRHDAEQVKVTLLEGRVRVEKAPSPPAPLPQAGEGSKPVSSSPLPLGGEGQGEGETRTTSSSLPTMPESILLEPGEQVTLVANREEIVRGKIADEQTVLSWTSGRLIFRSTPLVEAVAEVNRYARTKIRIADPRLRDLPISGTFVTGDSEILAAALEADFPVRAEQTARHEITLYRN